MLNDKDMDVLIRRYAKGAAPNAPVEHPDADELNAFAEGALPAAARQRYVSHFADCDDCRKLVSELAAAGAKAGARIPASEPVADSWWRKLSVLFAPSALRYAAFAVILLAVVGVAFVVWRRPADTPNANLLAQHQPQASPIDAIKPSGNQAASEADGAGKSTATTVLPQPTGPTVSDRKKLDGADLAQSPPPPPSKLADATAAKAPAPVVGGVARTGESPRADVTPSYAPAPAVANERYSQENRAREQNVNTSPGGPRRNESYDKLKEVDRSRSLDLAKSREDDRSRSQNKAAPDERKTDDATRAPTTSGVFAARGRRDEEKAQPRKLESLRESAEEAPEQRSAGGRKFNRQGNAWVDSKFKSSMSVRSVARGSGEFDKLDSGLRSIANQLGGEVIVVWKGKAYRIR